MPSNTESSSQILQASHEQDIGSNREICDTRNSPQVNFRCIDFIFQVYPNPKITNERSTVQHQS